MTLFFRLLGEADKADALSTAIHAPDSRTFDVDPTSFSRVPGSPFAYWATEAGPKAFDHLSPLQKEVLATSGTGTLDDFRFLRVWWEVEGKVEYYPYAKGGAYSPIYFDNYLVVQWKRDGYEMKSWIIHRYGGGSWTRNIRSTEHYGRPGLTWPRRTQVGLGLRVLPAGCIFADKGPGAFVEGDNYQELLSLLAITTSKPFCYLVELQMCFGSYEVGVIQRTPVPHITSADQVALANLSRRAWSLKRALDTSNETSHAFFLPAALLSGTAPDGFNPAAIQVEITSILGKIDDVAFRLYGLDGDDRTDVEGWDRRTMANASPIVSDDETSRDEAGAIGEEEEEEEAGPIDTTDALLSWSIGVAFGRIRRTPCQQ